jgi:hypothetical protein
MTFIELIKTYRAAVTAAPAQNSNPTESWNSLGEHLSWMLDNMPDEQADPLKFQRWLGFVQALLLVTGVYTLDQLRDQMRLCW